jgi:hypothetical protein
MFSYTVYQCVFFRALSCFFTQTPEIYFAGTGTDRAFTAMLFPRQNFISRTGNYNVITEFF